MINFMILCNLNNKCYEQKEKGELNDYLKKNPSRKNNSQYATIVSIGR